MLFDELADLARDADPTRLAETLEALAPRRNATPLAGTSFKRTSCPWQAGS